MTSESHILLSENETIANKEKALTPQMVLLQHERKKISFPVEKLTNLLDGGQDRSKERRQIGQFLPLKQLHFS